MTIVLVRRDINEDELTSKYIKCPECGENVKMEIKNYKISLYDCKNGHKINNILFNKYEDYQKKAISKIVNCDKNGLNNYQCSTHIRPFSGYCIKCKKNICDECFCEHSAPRSPGCTVEYFGKIFKSQRTLKEKLKEIKKPINKFNNNVNKLITMLNKVKDYINTYYNIINNIISNYDDKKINYEMLINVNEINDKKEIINDLEKINNADGMEKKFNNIVRIYNKFNQIRLELKVEKEDIGKNIYFLGDYIKNDKGGKDILLKELNEKNVELFVDGEKCGYKNILTLKKREYITY